MNYRSMGIRTEEELAEHLFIRYEHREREGIKELAEVVANLYYRIERLELEVRTHVANQILEGART